MSFDRLCSVLIGRPGVRGGGRRVTDLRIKFTVERDTKPTPNPAKVEIYNLSEASRSAIKEHLDTFTLFAGYRDEGGESVLFTGDVDGILHRFDLPDVITEIEAGDGSKVLRESRVSLSLEPGCKVADACRVIAQRMNLPIKELPDSALQLAQGFSYAGRGIEGLRKAAAAAGLEFSVQDGQVQFLEQSKGSAKDRVVVVSPSSGLIGYPERVIDAGTKTSKKAPAVQWRFRTLLNAQHVPGRRVQLDSRVVKGVFRLDKVRHTGDTHGDEWFSECEVSSEPA